MVNYKEILKKIWNWNKAIPAQSLQTPPKEMSDRDIQLLKAVGVTYNQLLQSVNDSTAINYERSSIYRELERAQSHWMMSSATDLFADFATPLSPNNNRTIWPYSKDTKYMRVLEKFLDEQEVEEKIFDWAWTTGGFGDLIVEVNGQPGLGIININDSLHPSAISRIDYDGTLLGFYQTPFDTGNMSMAAAAQNETELLPPWKYVHFRLLGSVKRRPSYADPTYQEHRTIYLMGAETKQVSTKYGTSLLFNGLPVYKRLRMAEDALLLARLTRGIMKYIYKIRVDSSNPEAAGQLIQEYMNILKHARAINTSDDNPGFENKSNPMSSVEDLFVPVFGEAGDVSIEKVGGEPDIKWIVDIEELRNQLACSLRVPLSLLGGYVQEASGSLGSEAISKLDIRFARSAKRLQRALTNGTKRLCQIHLAYLGMDPDPRLFDIQMGETNTEEEETIKKNIDTSTDTITKFMEMLDGLGLNLDKKEILNYFNKKLLKLNDFDLEKYIKQELPDMTGQLPEQPEPGANKEEESVTIADTIKREFYSYLPLNESSTTVSALAEMSASEWNKKYAGQSVQIKEIKG